VELEGNQIDLLISILVRFPQIGTVHYEPAEKALRIVFLIKGSRVDFASFVQNFEAIYLFSIVLGRSRYWLPL